MDAWIISRFDSVGIWLQKRGYLMTAIRLQWASAVLLLNVGLYAHTHEPILMLLSGVLFGLWTYIDVIFHKKYCDYPLSIKMCQELNAQVLLEHEKNWTTRMLGIWVVVVPGIVYLVIDLSRGDYFSGVMRWLASGVMVFYFYVECCSFVGPGEHSSLVSREAPSDVNLSRAD
jgi:hypothetical protein